MRKPWQGIVLMMAIYLGCSLAEAQRGPTIDVSGSENTYVLNSIQDNQIILYVIYDDTTKLIRGYALWNGSTKTARAELTFTVGSPLTLTALSNTRVTEPVSGRAYVMTLSSEGVWVDGNIKTAGLGHHGRLRSRLLARGEFPLPTQR